MPIQITAKRDGFRRCGIAHSDKTTTYDDGFFSKAQLAELKTEPQLIVTVVSGTAVAGDGDGKALKEALALNVVLQQQVSEKDSALLQLNDDIKALQQQLKASQEEVLTVSKDRDDLKAELAEKTKK